MRVGRGKVLERDGANEEKPEGEIHKAGKERQTDQGGREEKGASHDEKVS